MSVSSPGKPPSLADVRMAFLRESGYEPGLVNRAIQRVLQKTIVKGRDYWIVKGRPTLGDQHTSYLVRSINGAMACACQTHAYGDRRSKTLCSHIIAVEVVLRLEAPVVVNPPQEKTEGPWITPQELGLPDKFGGFRDAQLEALRRIKASSKKFILIQAPTGTGKSLLAAAIQKMTGKRTVYTAHTLQLQAQFGADFPHAVELKGRANYSTLNYPHRFPLIHAGMCQKGQQPHCDLCCQGGDDDSDTGCDFLYRCPYRRQKFLALKAPLANLNIAYFLAEANFIKGFSGWPQVILDEADLTESALLSFTALEITNRWIKRLGLEPPARKTVQEAWADWAVNEALPKIKGRLLELHGYADYTSQKEREDLSRMEVKMTWFSKEVLGGNWVFMSEGEEAEDNRRWTWKPIRVSNYANQYLWRHGHRFFLMSATLISPQQTALDLGIPQNEIEWIDLPMSFPQKNRLIHYRPATVMSYANKDESWPEMVQAIDDVLDAHVAEKGLIHTVSYALARYIMENSRHTKRLVTYGAGQREHILEAFKESKLPQVLVAPSMDRGVDLPQDECRFIIISKIPFLSLGDKQVSERLYRPGDGKRWYAVNVIRVLCQMTGRGVRSEEDTCTSYILDAQFADFWGKWKKVFPAYWRSAVVFPKKVFAKK